MILFLGVNFATWGQIINNNNNNNNGLPKFQGKLPQFIYF